MAVSYTHLDVYKRQTLTCKECGKEFVFSASEQEFYAEKGFQNDPARCFECRQARKRPVSYTHLTHRGNKFENRTVEYIIHNPVYIGKLRRMPAGKANRDYDNPQLMIVDGQHQALIDDYTWQAAQQRAKEIKAICRPYYKPASSKKSWLSGLLYLSLIHIFSALNPRWCCSVAFGDAASLLPHFLLHGSDNGRQKHLLFYYSDPRQRLLPYYSHQRQYLLFSPSLP